MGHGIDIIVQPTGHGKTYHCTAHDAWGVDMFRCVVQPMGAHSATFSSIVLCNTVSQYTFWVGSYVGVHWPYAPRGLGNKVSIHKGCYIIV